MKRNSTRKGLPTRGRNGEVTAPEPTKDEAKDLLQEARDDVVGYLNTLSAESAYTPVLIEKLHRIDAYLKYAVAATKSSGA